MPGSLQAELVDTGVTVTTIAPGYIKTDHAASALGGQGMRDEDGLKGMEPAELAAMMADAIADGKAELIPSQLDGRLGIWLRAFAPQALFKIMASKARKAS